MVSHSLRLSAHRASAALLPGSLPRNTHLGFDALEVSDPASRTGCSRFISWPRSTSSRLT
jgi:hypothetical protein